MSTTDIRESIREWLDKWGVQISYRAKRELREILEAED